jgi:hypothetical protein
MPIQTFTTPRPSAIMAAANGPGPLFLGVLVRAAVEPPRFALCPRFWAPDGRERPPAADRAVLGRLAADFCARAGEDVRVAISSRLPRLPLESHVSHADHAAPSVASQPHRSPTQPGGMPQNDVPAERGQPARHETRQHEPYGGLANKITVDPAQFYGGPSHAQQPNGRQYDVSRPRRDVLTSHHGLRARQSPETVET